QTCTSCDIDLIEIFSSKNARQNFLQWRMGLPPLRLWRRTVEISGKQRGTRCFFLVPTPRQPRISAPHERRFADNLPPKQREQRALRCLLSATVRRHPRHRGGGAVEKIKIRGSGASVPWRRLRRVTKRRVF